MEAAMASYPIARMRAVSPFYAAKLKAAGIRTTTRLLERANSPRLRKQLSEETKISINLILDWANIADLTRIPGVALTYAELLAAAGIDTVKELKRRNCSNLARGLAEVNEKKKLVELLPSEKVVAGWIAQAKLLEPVMSY
jgi:predicted flap endonuclease-1-like 5' DNA nuclease